MKIQIIIIALSLTFTVSSTSANEFNIENYVRTDETFSENHEEFSYFKTPYVHNFGAFELINPPTSREDIRAALGAPLSEGVWRFKGDNYKLEHYASYAMKWASHPDFNRGEAAFDFGYGFFAYDKDGELVKGYYYRREKSDGVIPLRIGLDLAEFEKQIIPGKTHVDKLYQKFGAADYYGRKYNKLTKTDTYLLDYCDDITQYRARTKGQYGVALNRFTQFYVDDKGTIQGMYWAASQAEDLEKLDSIPKSQLPQSHRVLASRWTPENVNTDNIIDLKKVDELIEQDVSSAHQFIDVLGKPTGIGMVDSNDYEQPLHASIWSKFNIMRAEDKIDNYTVPSAHKPRPSQEGNAYTIDRSERNVLVIFHTDSGEIKDLHWVKHKPDSGGVTYQDDEFFEMHVR